MFKSTPIDKHLAVKIEELGEMLQVREMLRLEQLQADSTASGFGFSLLSIQIVVAHFVFF